MCSNKEKKVLIFCCGGWMEGGGMASSGDVCDSTRNPGHGLGGS